MRRPLKLAIPLLAFAVFSAFSVTVKNDLRKATSPLENLPLGADMPSFALPDRTDASVKFESGPQTAKLTLINFWATWCGPCRMEMPVFEKLYAGKQKDGFLILSINEDEKRSDLEEYLQKKPVTFPVLLDADGALAKQFGVRAYPTSILVDQEGKIVQVIEGLESYLSFVVDGYLQPEAKNNSSSTVIEVQWPAKEKAAK